MFCSLFIFPADGYWGLCGTIGSITGQVSMCGADVSVAQLPACDMDGL